jgi:DNA-binding transcriptional regulator/RsmH inhibitor MraZ
VGGTSTNSQFLRGTFTGVKVEPGGRIVVPRRWREVLPVTEWVGSPWPLLGPRALAVFPVGKWEERYNLLVLQRMEAERTGNDDILKELIPLMRLMNATAEDLKLDNLGRLCLGANLMGAIGLKGEAVLRGVGENFEVLTPARYEAERREQQEQSDLDEATLRRYGLS